MSQELDNIVAIARRHLEDAVADTDDLGKVRRIAQRRRVRRAAAAATMIVIGVGGTVGFLEGRNDPVAVVTGSATGGNGVLIGCGSYAYPPSALQGPTGAESADDPAAAALRDLIDNAAGTGLVPPSGWRRLFDNGDIVVFGSGDVTQPGTEEGLVEVTVERSGEEFRVVNSAYGCVPRTHVEGRSLAEFTVAPDVTLSPEITAVEVLVTELSCTGATPVDDRLDPPVIRYLDASIEVLFTAHPLEGEFFTCPGNPAARVTLVLDEPLRDRQLLDLSTYPPRDATQPGITG